MELRSCGQTRTRRITVANCDSAAGADAQLAIEMAARAVSELG
jgi:hypothetical protein